MSTYEISKSSLVSLKAEILRKHQEIANAKSDNERKIKLIKKNTPLEFKNKISNKGDKNDAINILHENDEDQTLLKKSRQVLEQKSALYDRLRSGNVTEEEKKQNKSFLVQFDKKDDESFKESDEEPDKYSENDDDDYEQYEDESTDPLEKWVDYVDCLGRTRKCLQKDLDYLKSKDSELRKIVEAKKRAAENNSNTVSVDSNQIDNSEEVQNDDDTQKPAENSEGELLSSDIRREMLRQQWEKEEEDNRKKSDIHYQDVLFGEARSHGVGYYGFSKHEDERLKQQEALKQLREETEQKQKRAQELKIMREKQLAARIKAAKDRKRARLGLPPEEEEPETAKPQISEEEKQQELELERQNKEKEQLLEEARKRHLRPWDVGKEGVTKEHVEMSQEEWNEMKRTERVEEFAPPSSYTKKKQVDDDNDKLKNTKRAKQNKKLRNEKKSLPKYKKRLINNKSGDTNRVEENSPVMFEAPYNINQNDKMQNSERGRGTEIPPPMNFDYFGASSSKVPRTSSVNNDINESVEAGLKFLRNQIEKKAKPPKNVFYI